MNRMKRKSKSMKPAVKVLGAAVLSAALLASCSAAKPEAAPAASTEAQIKTVKVSPVEKQKIGEPLEQVADVASSIQLDVLTKSGGDVQAILKKRGDMVEKGEVIFRMDPTDVLIQKEKAQITLNSSQEQISKAKATLADSRKELQNGITKLEQAIKDAEKNYNKLRNDYDLGLVTKIQLEQAETQLNSQKLDLEANRSKLQTLDNTNNFIELEQGIQTANVSLREADRTLGNMEVKAAVSGVLTDLPIQEGMTLSAGFSAAKIQQLDPIKIKAELAEDAANLVRGKSELIFYIPGVVDKTAAKVSYLADVMSGETKAYSLELEVPNADRKLKPGMKAQIQLTGENEQMVVAVPTLSVVREGGDTFVFVLAGDQAEKRKVQLGRLNETIQEVISGVKEGEQLIISGQNQLKDKEKVQLAK
ncbi:efflux RND transporter periplasmic adaptor subunit [Paenibacillus mucilaginosus]|uniref:RND transporter n=3 Tax=Paenibacillus mucilaginosus TaxID=61624 RepID=I0BPZ8_9BACL|nr:efflux RND transporter periplasmic adaptor subunit [Paenibacillus mucilaginosus]AEI42534.1 putative efflux system [Paenibacillus mucilaginosus KNP414]AFC32075.1 putative efflux system [Paenibacillus mucilaginosus 3016]AFH64445.1 RND transporter [Paenibacillus mucilaginosus K02]MCG7213927.1 efflux RND transporter periplasmic adaptor subunit [Paenibacillus mucilaginosus]WDM25932.1 efflux RND transporter periplasmic adaptor subunit [Paenibacillus mucilaginosus]